MSDVFVIAEAGVNHDGDLMLAKELVEAAAQAGANAVKFQTFVSEQLVHPVAAKANYQVGYSRGETQLEMLRNLELARESHYELRDLAELRGVEFMSTPFDLESLDFLANDVGVRRVKISSGDLTNLPLLHFAGQTGLPVILSTGMGTVDDVRCGVGAVAHGRLVSAGDKAWQPGPAAFNEVLATRESASLLHDVTLLQCTSEYPAPDFEANLLAMRALADEFSLQVGFSDHSLGIHLSVAAVALGASVVEKHLTLDTRAAGPDHRASLDVATFTEMIEAIRSVERAMGSPRKVPSSQETENARLARRGLYAARDLNPGDVLSEADIAILRPENGVPPSRYWEFVGSTVSCSIPQGGALEK